MLVVRDFSDEEADQPHSSPPPTSQGAQSSLLVTSDDTIELVTSLMLAEDAAVWLYGIIRGRVLDNVMAEPSADRPQNLYMATPDIEIQEFKTLIVQMGNELYGKLQKSRIIRSNSSY